MAATGTESPAGFRGDIQGLRAVAVGAVVLYHAGVPFLPGGFVGVDVFFVISGFLITTHLLTELDREGRVRFARFYARRARRILPAAFVVLAASVVAALIWYPPLLMGEVWKDAVATALYVPNYLFAVEGTDYLAEQTPSLFQHYWSLGIEEQFYLLWPVVLAAAAAFTRTRRALFVILAALVAVSFAVGVAQTYSDQPWAFFSLPTRAWELGAGGLLAIAVSRGIRVPARLAPTAGWIGLAGIVAAIVLFDAGTLFPGVAAALPVAATLLVIFAGTTSSRGAPTAVLSTPGMMFVGAISYSLYLVHWPALLVPQAASGFTAPLPLAVALGIAVLCVPAAWVLHRLVENPVRRAPWLVTARPRRSLAAALGGSAACVLLASAAAATASAAPLRTDALASSAVTAPPAATSFVPANVTPDLRDVRDDEPVIYADGCVDDYRSSEAKGCVYEPAKTASAPAPRIVLFGDSHAASWFPAVAGAAEAQGYALQVFTKASCRSLEMPQERDGVPYVSCDHWRAKVLERLGEDPPALVILANYAAAADNVGADRWREGLTGTLDAIDVPVVILADSPDLRTPPAVCLSAHLTDTPVCSVSAAEALRPEVRAIERAVAAAEGAEVIDLGRFFCDDTCGPIIGDTVVYRDAHHLTATFSELLAPPLARELAPILAGVEESPPAG